MPHTYPAGWSMIGVPTGVTFPIVDYACSYADGRYQCLVPDHPSPMTGCQAAWIYLLTPKTVDLGLPATYPSGITYPCPLRTTGWNMLGNPFTVPAALPSGITAFWWDSAKQQYDVVSAIPVGASVWIYVTAPGTIMLTTQ